MTKRLHPELDLKLLEDTDIIQHLKIYNRSSNYILVDAFKYPCTKLFMKTLRKAYHKYIRQEFTKHDKCTKSVLEEMHGISSKPYFITKIILEELGLSKLKLFIIIQNHTLVYLKKVNEQMSMFVDDVSISLKHNTSKPLNEARIIIKPFCQVNDIILNILESENAIKRVMLTCRETKYIKLDDIPSLKANTNCAANCLRDDSGELDCEHRVCKNCLIRLMLREFLKSKPYKYLFFCSICQSTEHIKSITLDCGCSTPLKDKRCDHPLSLVDSCIMSNFISSEYTYLLAEDYLKKEHIPRDLCDEIIQSGNMKIVGLMLKFNEEITKLDLGKKDIECISEGLKVNRTLTHLSLAFNKIQGSIEEALKVNKTLERLDLQYTQCNIEEVLKVNKGITYLILKNSEIKCEKAKRIGDALKVNTTLTELDLSYNQIKNDEGMAEGLKHNKVLTQLNLAHNGINRVESISKMLLINKALIKLDLSQNNIGYKGVNAICKALEVNKNITQLHLAQCNIDHKGALVISRMLTVNGTLTELNLEYNRAGIEGANAIGSALKTNKSLLCLFLTMNHLKAEGSRGICEGLKVNDSITRLDIRSNSIGDEGVRAIIEMLEVNERLTQLNIRFNHLSPQSVRLLRDKAVNIEY